MTKRDFEFIAATLREELTRDAPIAWDRLNEGQAAVVAVCDRFADRLAMTNPSFNRARFLAACGVEG